MKPRFVTLLPTTINTGNTATAGSAVCSLEEFTRALLMLTISDKTMDASTTLDIYVQYSPDEGTTWDDIACFSQVTSGALADGTYVVALNHGAVGVVDRATDDGATITANSVRNQPWGDRMRIKYDGGNFSGSDTITIAVAGWFYP